MIAISIIWLTSIVLVVYLIYLIYIRNYWKPIPKGYNEKIDFIINAIKEDSDESKRLKKEDYPKYFGKLLSVDFGKEPYLIDSLKENIAKRYELEVGEVEDLFSQGQKDNVIVVVYEKGLIISTKMQDLLNEHGTYTKYYIHNERKERFQKVLKNATSVLSVYCTIGGLFLTYAYNDYLGRIKTLEKGLYNANFQIQQKDKSLYFRGKNIEAKEALLKTKKPND